MAHLEIQIANAPLLQALKQLALPRLYNQCYVIPVEGLLLDHVEIGTPADPQLTAGAAGRLTVALPVSIFLVKPSDVIAANGGSAAEAAAPQVTCDLLIEVSRTTMTVAYTGVRHDVGYQALFTVIEAQVGLAEATALFAKWEAAIQTQLGGAPLLVYPFTTDLPPELAALTFGRSALSTGSQRIAIRLEIGAAGSDGNWTAFLAGNLSDQLNGNDWSVFVTSDGVTQIADVRIHTLGAAFGGAEAGPSVWAPQGATAAVDSTVDATIHVHIEGPASIVVFDGDVPLSISLRTTFSMAPYTVLNAQKLIEGVMRTDISFTYQIIGNFIADVANFLAHAFSFGNDLPVPAGFTKAGDTELYSDTPIPTQVLADELTLTATTVFGTADGMIIAGTARLANSEVRPDCNVQATPFALSYITSCSAIRDHNQPLPTADYVTAMASFAVGESGAPGQVPLALGGLVPVGTGDTNSPPNPPDPLLQFLPHLPQVPSQPASSFDFRVIVRVGQMLPAYIANPYPCEFIVLSSGGARYVSLGAMPKPEQDPRTGFVTNALTIYIPDCHLGEVAPWTVTVLILDPAWLVDPGPESVAEREENVARIIVGILTQDGAGQVTPIVVGGIQIGTAATAAVMPGHIMGNTIAGIGMPVGESAAKALRLAALSQPPGLELSLGTKPKSGR